MLASGLCADPAVCIIVEGSCFSISANYLGWTEAGPNQAIGLRGKGVLIAGAAEVDELKARETSLAGFPVIGINAAGQSVLQTRRFNILNFGLVCGNAVVDLVDHQWSDGTLRTG